MRATLFAQILRFGIVGFISFIVDFVITNIVAWLLREAGAGMAYAALSGGLLGFVVSVTVNYLLSMRYVFVGRTIDDRRQEFVIFVILSIVGLAINELIIMGCISAVENLACGHGFVQWTARVAGIFMPVTHAGMVTAISKVIATAVVMVYNFITRKFILEGKAKG